MPKRTDRQTYFRSKSVVLTERDELAYSRVLREFDPDVQFTGLERGLRQYKTRLVPTITDGEADIYLIRILHPEEKNRMKINKGLDLKNVKRSQTQTRLELQRSYWDWVDPAKKWAFDPPLLDWGLIIVGYPVGDEEAKRFAMQILRLAGKVTWRRGRFGLDACRWSQTGGKERRGLGNGQLIDPSEDIQLNKYYDDTLWDDEGLPPKPTGVRV